MSGLGYDDWKQSIRGANIPKYSGPDDWFEIVLFHNKEYSEPLVRDVGNAIGVETNLLDTFASEVLSKGNAYPRWHEGHIFISLKDDKKGFPDARCFLISAERIGPTAEWFVDLTKKLIDILDPVYVVGGKFTYTDKDWAKYYLLSKGQTAEWFFRNLHWMNYFSKRMLLTVPDGERIRNLLSSAGFWKVEIFSDGLLIITDEDPRDAPFKGYALDREYKKKINLDNLKTVH